MKKTLIAATLASCGLAAQAQISGDVVKVGFLTDMSSVYADIDGAGGVEAIKMAIADLKGVAAGKKVEFIFADHQNKADVASAKAREWFDTQGLDLLIGGTNSGANLAMATVAAEKKKPFIAIGAGSSALTNANCTPYTIHYAYDTVAVVTKTGGTVKGSVKHPLNASDFSSFLLQAQGSGAQILGLANAGGDTINAVKAANEFGITKGMKLAGLLMFINDVHSLGLKTTEGMYLTDSWYWNQTPEARAWSRRFFEKMKRMPSSLQAADYSAVTHYLKAVDAIKTDDADKVIAQMKATPIKDFYTTGTIRKEDGRGIHDMYLMQVKSPKESTEPWDYYKVVAKIPGEEAFTKLADSKCPLVKK